MSRTCSPRHIRDVLAASDQVVFNAFTYFEKAFFNKESSFIAMKGESFLSMANATFVTVPNLNVGTKWGEVLRHLGPNSRTGRSFAPLDAELRTNVLHI